MPRQAVYVVYADGDEELAENLAQPLRDAGYDVAHNGTIAVGESLVGEAQRALSSGSPIVLCATAKAVGSAWAHQIVNAAHGEGPIRVFVVQMEKHAFVKQLALDSKPARYCDDPAQALCQLRDALAENFPPLAGPTMPVGEAVQPANAQFLDSLSGTLAINFEDLKRFRDELRPEVSDRYPAALTPEEFLSRTGLRNDGLLNGTGILLFAREPTKLFPVAIVKCTRYFGDDRASRRDSLTFDGAVPSQIVAARQFVADRVQIGEVPSSHQAGAAVLYDYPMVAIREIIANALAHRDYAAADSCVHVRIFNNRLEVSSPGQWLGRNLSPDVEYSIDELKGQSIKRNFRLARVLSWARLVEGEGSGIPSALRACQTDRCPIPTVRQEQGFVTVTLRKKETSGASYGATARLASALRELYANADWPSPIALAAAVGNIGESTVTDVLNGTRIPDWSIIASIVQQLGGSQEDFEPLWLSAEAAATAVDSESSSMRAFVAAYKRQAALRHGYVTTPSFATHRRIPIGDIYVAPMIVEVGEVGNLWQLDDEVGHMVLLGSPGSGKTTTCAALLHRYAVESERAVPFFVRIRDFAAQPLSTRSVVAYIEDQLTAFYQLLAPPGAVVQLLRRGDALVFFDGLDELLDGALRADVGAMIEQFVAAYPLVQVLVTSRLVGYELSPLDDRQFKCFRLGEFADTDVAAYVSKWFASREVETTESARQMTQAFLDESSVVSDLRRNPLLLSLMCELYAGEGYLSRNRVNIYEKCADLLFDRWDKSRGIVSGNGMDSYIQRATGHLAWWMFDRDPNRPVSEREIVEEITKRLYHDVFESELEAGDAAARFAEFCRGRAWVLANVGVSAKGEPLYAFTHRAFLEYFAAAHLVRFASTPERIAEELARRIIGPSWHQVGLIAVELFDRVMVDGANQMLAVLLAETELPADGRAQVLQIVAEYRDLMESPT